MALQLTSSVFDSGEMIPDRFTCEGADISPPLSWSNGPDEVQEFALICEDPDAPAGTFTHWVIYNIPARKTTLAENIPAETNLPWGGRQGRNHFGNIGYGGPCPPQGAPHRYYFRLYALDEELDLPPGLSRNQLLEEMEEYIIEKTALIGRYGRT